MLYTAIVLILVSCVLAAIDMFRMPIREGVGSPRYLTAWLQESADRIEARDE